jgi:hypothetical protein
MASFINQALECMMEIVQSPPASQTVTTVPKFLALSRIRYHWGDIEGIDLSMTLTPRGIRTDCRNEILRAAKTLLLEGRGEFKVEDIISQMKHNTQYEYTDGTIRTHISSKMCANAPNNHAATYNDLLKTERGTYKLLEGNQTTGLTS